MASVGPPESSEKTVAYLIATRAVVPLLVGVTIVVLWRLLCLLLRKAKQLSFKHLNSYISSKCAQQDAQFAATSRGYRLQGFTADAGSLQLTYAGCEVRLLVVQDAELVWPSWQKRRLQLNVQGLFLELLQLGMPLAPASPPDLASAGQLQLLEQLLWDGNEAGSSSKSSSWLRWVMKTALGHMEVQMQDCCVQYVAPGHLGPAAVPGDNSSRDGIVLNVRSINLGPAVCRRHVPSAPADTTLRESSRWQTAAGPSDVAGPDNVQQLVTQLDVTGVGLSAVTSQESPLVQAPYTSAVGSSAHSAVQGGETEAWFGHNGWKQQHVLLRQWQCSVSVVLSGRSGGSDGKHSVAKQTSPQAAANSQLDPAPAAVSLRYWTAGLAEVDESQQSEPSKIVGHNNSTRSQNNLGIVIELKSLVMSLPPSAAAIVSRVLTRQSEYRQLSPIWSVRPTQPVSASPTVWWQHACDVVLAECRRRRPPHSLRLSLSRRRHYIFLYRAVHSQQPGYIRDGREKKRMPVSGARKELKLLEATMTVCEVATHRIFVALVHSQHLQRHPALQEQWIEALDGLGGFIDLIPGRGQGANNSEPGFAVALNCPAICVQLTSDQHPQSAQLTVEAHQISASMPSTGCATATVDKLQVSVCRSSSSQTLHKQGSVVQEVDMLSVLEVPHVDKSHPSTTMRSSTPAQQHQQPQVDPLPVARPAKLGRIYPDSLVATYLNRLKVRLGAITLELQPQLAEQALDYYKAFKAFVVAPGAASLQYDKPVPVKQMILESFKNHRVPTSFALSSLLPVMDVSCPQLSVVAPLRRVHRLDGTDNRSQADPDTAVELVLRLSQLHASVGYNSSCYSSLLQQVDATADIDLLIQQQITKPSAARQLLGQYGAIWMHPDDATQLGPSCYSSTTPKAARRSLAAVKPFFGSPSPSANAPSSFSGWGGSNGSSLPVTLPYTPVVKVQRLWARLSTHVPTEPAVVCGEHTTAGVSVAGLLMWVSPWQVGLLLAVADQLATDGETLWQRLQHTLQSPQTSVVEAAASAAAASAVHAAISDVQEVGSAAAAASKAATAVVQAAGAVAPSAVIGETSPVVKTNRHGQYPLSKHKQDPSVSAKQASRAAADRASISLVCVVPYCEVLCFADLAEQQQTSKSSSKKASHRYRIVPPTVARSSCTRPAGPDSQQSSTEGNLMQQWSNRLAPVASLVLCGFKAGSGTGADGAVAAQMRLSSLMLVNLQLLDLCKSAATMPSAAGVYLPAGYAVPTQPKKPTSSVQPTYIRSSMAGVSNSFPGQTTAAGAASISCLAANHNAFVLSTFTSRLTATYQAAALNRWNLLGLSHLAAGPSSPGDVSLDGANFICRGSIGRRLLLRKRWQQVLELRAFARTLDYAMFLLFQQGRSSPTQISGLGAQASQFEEYQLLYLHSMPSSYAATHPAIALHVAQPALPFTRKGSSSAEGVKGVAAGTAHLQPGSPCNWKSSSFHRALSDRLVVVAQPSNSGSTVSSVDGTAVSVLPAVEVKQQRQQLPQSRFPQHAAAPATAGRQPLQDSAVAESAGQSAAVATSKALQGPKGMPVMAALRSMRTGSQGLLQRLWQRKQAAAEFADASSKSPGILGSKLRSKSILAAKPAKGQQAGTSRASQPLHVHTESLHGHIQLQQQRSLVDFLDKFTVSYLSVSATSTGVVDSSPTGSPRSPGDWSHTKVRVVTAQQPQLAASYKQHPAPQQQKQPQAPTGFMSAAMEEPEDALDITLCHVKATVGPHTVSMLLQLMTSLSTAASSRRPTVKQPPDKPPPAVGQVSGTTGSQAYGRLRVGVHLVLCHAMLNMERALLPDRLGAVSGCVVELQTKALLSLRLLDVKTSVLRQWGVSSEQPSDQGSTQQEGTEGSCSVAHIGLQDLCACKEQRHVLSGAGDPWTATSAPSYSFSRRRHQAAACSISSQAMLPAAGSPDSALVTVTVYNPKLVLLRRFATDVLYVLALINHEIAASRPPKDSGSGAKASTAQDTSETTSTVVLATLHNVQLVLPRSHACKTLDDKYAEAGCIHSEAEKQRQQQAADAERRGHSRSGWSGNSTDSTRGDSSGAAGEPSNRQRGKPQDRGPLHAHHPEVLLLQASSITVAAPADPGLLLQVHSELAAYPSSLSAANPPLWMREAAAVRQMLNNSKAIMSCSGTQVPSTGGGQQHQAVAPVERTAENLPAAAEAAAAAQTASGGHAEQPQQASHNLMSKDQAHFAVGRKQQPAAAVRHGVLLVSEGGMSADELHAQLAPVPTFALGAVTNKLWKRFIAKVKPRRSKLVVRPGSVTQAGGSAAAATWRGAAKPAVPTNLSNKAGQSANLLPEGHTGSTSAPSDNSSGLLLVDFHGLELFAGKMVREQDTTCHSADLVASSTSSQQYSTCQLTSLVHMITQTNIQMVVYEYDAGSALSKAGPSTTPANVIALSASAGLSLQISSSSYRCLMDTLYGNLMYWCSTFQAGSIQFSPPPAHQTSFQPNLKFGPRSGQLPSFGVTISSPAIQGTLWSDQRWWTPTNTHFAPQLSYATPSPFSSSSGGGSSVVPIVSLSWQEASVCVQFMRSTNDMHVNLYAQDTEWRDVRMASTDLSCPGSSFRKPNNAGRRSEYETAHEDLRQPDNLRRFEKARQNASSSTAEDMYLGASNPQSARASWFGRSRSDYEERPASRDGGRGDWALTSDDVLEGPDVRQFPDPPGVRFRSSGRSPGFGPGTTRPINLHSRPERLTPKPESLDEDGSVHGVSSEETLGEQQLDVSELYPSLLQPPTDGNHEVPDLSIIRVLDELPADESAHLANKGKRAKPTNAAGPSESAAFKFHMGYMKEGTMTVELTLGSALLQWPYLSDLSLVSAMINIFHNDWGAAPKLPPAWLQLKRNAWLYFNLVITDSQIFMPLLTPHMDPDANSASSEAGRPDTVPSPFAVLQDIVRKQASLTGEDIEAGRGQPLQQMGVALTFGAFRFGYFYGGDGEAIMRFDLRNIAGFIRDQNAIITNWLLPMPSAKLEMKFDWPMVEEHRALEPLLMMSRRMLLCYNVRKRERRRKQREARAAAGLPAAPSSELSKATHSKRQASHAADKQDNASGSYTTSAARAAAAAAATPEQRLLALACEHAEDLFGERVTADWHNTWVRHLGASHPAQTNMGLLGQSGSGMFGVYKRKARSELLIALAPVTVRAAFSNINAWKTLQADMDFASRAQSSGLGMWPPTPDIQAEVLSVRAAGGVWPPPPTGWAAEFRRSSMRYTIEVATVMLMLCDDKPHSFGAPDVLQAMACGVSFIHALEYRYPRTAPERADRLHVEGGVGASILNNSNSKWEVLLEPWPLLISLSDPINPLSKGDRTLYGQALSSDPLRINFHPSSLLSIGDLLAFVREASAAPASTVSQQQGSLRPTESVPLTLLEEAPSVGPFARVPPAHAANGASLFSAAPQRRVRMQQPVRGLNHTEAPPSIEQQMGLGQGLSSRIPQRYLIQNLTGSHIFYWSPMDAASCGMHGAKRRVLLPAHAMHELKVTPAPRKMQHLSADGSLVSSGLANAICIQLAGSWLPLEDVAVDVVGKYRYELRDPLGGACLPIVLDVLLVGRTKMLRLHSCIWLENNTGMKLEPCLQLGSGCTTPVVLGSGDKLDSLQRLYLRPLQPKEGRFLPVAAALGGLLFLAPEGHQPAEHDVMRLSVSLKALSQQQGYIQSQSKPDGIQHGLLHLAATVSQGLQTDPYFTTQNLTEVPRAGTLRKARTALEASIHVRPTLQLANGLPYDMLGWALLPPNKDVTKYPFIAQNVKAGSKASGAAANFMQKLTPDSKSQVTAGEMGDAPKARSGSSHARTSFSGASVAQAAAVAAAAHGNSVAGLQQVLSAGDRRAAALALGSAVAAAGPPLQILEHLSCGEPHALASPSTPVAQSLRMRRGSLFGSVTGGSGLLLDHNSEGLAAQRRRGSAVLSPTPATSFKPARVAVERAAATAAQEQASQLMPERHAGGLQLSQACELLLLQRWCKDLLLEEFLTTVHLVMSPDIATKVDVAALWLLDLSSLVALVLGVLAEEFAWIAKSFPLVFNLLLRVEEVMENTANPSNSDAAPVATPLQAHQLPWAADQLPIAELFSLLQWMQQSVVRLQLAPGGTADLYLDPQLEVYAALRVPALAMQSRPTLITGGLGNQTLGGCDSLWLAYSSKLDMDHTSKAVANVHRQCLAGSELSFPGQPRLGLAALQALGKLSTLREEVTTRMTDVARQLAELASRQSLVTLHLLSAGPTCPCVTAYLHSSSELLLVPGAMQKISPLHTRPPLYHDARLTPIDSEDFEATSRPSSTLLAAGSVPLGPGSGFQLPQPLQHWSSAPEGLPVSFAPASGLHNPFEQQPVQALSSGTELLSWFAVIVELLGDVVRLAAHEIDMMQQAADREGNSASMQQSRFGPEQLIDELELADVALFVLGDSLHLQAVQAAGGRGADGRGADGLSATRANQSSGRSSIPAADSGFGASSYAAININSQASALVDIPSTIASISEVLLKPPDDVDRIFTQFNLHKAHVLTDDEMQALLRFSCHALIDHMVTTSPLTPQSAATAPASPKHRRGGGATPLQRSATTASANRAGSGRKPRLPKSSSDNEISLLLSPSSSSSTAFSPQPSHSSPPSAGRQLSRLHQPTWQDNELFDHSMSESGGAPSAPQTPVPGAPPSTPSARKQPHLSRGFGNLESGEQHEDLQAGQPGQGTALARSRLTLAIPDHPSRAATPAVSSSGSPSGTAAGRGIKSLRSLWPRVSHSGTELAAGKAAAEQGRAARSSNESEDSSEEENPFSPKPRGSWHGSFRRRPGASVKHLARVMGRASGAPVRLVHGQLSEQLRAALDRKMKSTPPHLLPPGAVSGRLSTPQSNTASGPGSGVLRHHGQQWWSMTLQALGREAVAAEVHEGRPGFCAPHNLRLSLISSGGSPGLGRKGNGSSSSTHKRSNNGNNSATLHVLLTASFWLDNRSGLNLVLSDLDRRVLKGLPGPHLKSTADVHSPGLPRDCAALEASEPDLSTLLANNSSQENLADAVADTAGNNYSSAVDTSEGDVELALSRLQEVRPALLNDQSWLRFWVEEHVILPPGSRLTSTKSRRTFSFKKAPASLLTAFDGAGASGVPHRSSSAPADDGLRASTTAGQVQAIRSQPSKFFKIAVTGHKSDIQVKGRKVLAQLTNNPGPPEPSPSIREASTAALRGSNTNLQQELLGQAATTAFAGVDNGLQIAEGGQVGTAQVWDPATPLVVPVQRAYEFAVEVWPTPAEGSFRATKVISIKSKYILFNDTGMVLEYKQKGTPDPNHPGYQSYGEGRRFAGLLQPQERVAFHWDNVTESRLLLIRPASPGWPWSGAFPLLDKEDYIGLRLRNRSSEDALIIPVNTTVGRSGSVLVTFKSTNSVPPLRIENRTKSVTVMLRQHLDVTRSPATAVAGSIGTLRASTMASRKETSPRVSVDAPAGWSWDSLAPSGSIPFAWDDVTGREVLEVAAGVLGPDGIGAGQILAAGRRNMFVLDLETIQKKPHVMVVRPVARHLHSTRNSAVTAAAAQAAVQGIEPSMQGSAPQVASQGGSAVAASASRSSAAIPPQQQQPIKPMLSVRTGGSLGGTADSVQALHKDSKTSSIRGPSVHEPHAASGSAVVADAAGPNEHKAATKAKGTVFDKKMYVSLYADGPTRVLCFSDNPIAGTAADDEGGSSHLMSRLHQVARQLMQVDRQLAAYLGSSYAMRATRGSRAVPAMLLLQQPQNRTSGEALQLPPALQNAAGGWYASGTSAAAVALLQQMELHPGMQLDRGQAPAVMDSTRTLAGPDSWSDMEPSQASYTHSSRQPAPSMTAQSQISNKAAAGAAAAAAAGVRLAGGMLSVDAADGGLRIYYDKLTLLLDSALPLGGNCTVKLLAAKGLVPNNATDRYYAFQARLAISGRPPVMSGLATPIKEQSEVTWEHEEQFEEVTAVSELIIETWGIPNPSVFVRGQHAASGSGRQAAADSAKGRYLRVAGSLPAGSVFLGAVQVPLMHTLPGTGNNVKEPRWYNLLRVRGDQQVSGQVQLSVAWSFTRETLLASELSMLERLLEARQEVLALLRPLSSTKVARMVGLMPVGRAVSDTALASDQADLGTQAASGSRAQLAHTQDDSDGSSVGEDAFDETRTLLSAASDSLDHNISGAHHQPANSAARKSIVSSPNVFAGLDLGMADSSVVTLEVDVVEVANLSPRSGWSQDLTHALLTSAGASSSRDTSNNASLLLSETIKSSDLPLPVVYVFCGTGQPADEGFEVASGVHTLNPSFGRIRHQFQQVGLRSALRVLVYDRHSAFDSRLLGLARLPAAAIPASSGPLYMWLPLALPPSKSQDRLARLQGYLPGAVHGIEAAKSVRFGSLAADGAMLQHTARGQLQVLLRVCVKKPATHNTTASLQANLAGLLVNAKTPGGDELLNLTVDTVQCSMVTSSRERQLSVSVRSVQLDNQLLETRQPVVLSPATMGEELAGYNLPKDKHRITLATDKTLDDMESPARAMFAAVAKPTHANSSSQQAATSSRQLQVTSPGSSLSAATRKVPLIRVSICQTLTKPLNGSEGSDHGSDGARRTADIAASANSSTAGDAAGTREARSAVSKAAIMSFRKMELLMGALDLKTDQAFLEGVFTFIQNMPLEDLWQDAAWQQRVALLQGSSRAGTTAGSIDSDQSQQQQQSALLMGRRSTVLTLPPAATQAAPAQVVQGPRQQLLAAAAAARIHAQQMLMQQQQQRRPGTFVHGRSRSAGSLPTNWDLQLELAPSFAGGDAVLTVQQPSPAAIAAIAATPTMAVVRASRRAIAARRAALNSILVLAWLPGKHDQELNSMKGQSSTWYFLEKLYVSALCLNVTIALTSSIRSATAGQAGGSHIGVATAAAAAGDGLGKALGQGAMSSEVQRTVVKGIVNRLSGGNNGLQLINVSDVALRLGDFKLEGRLLNQVGLSSELYRHYFWAALAELRKVLGGAGPGLVQLPASIIWAGFSVVDLLLELQQGRQKPLHSAFALMHVAFTLLSQLSGVATRFIVSMYALVPVQRHGTLSDHSALQRYVRMPATAGEAFYQAVVELYLGAAAGVLGLILDPMAGLRLPGALGAAGAVLGLVKGAAGLMVRPGMGVLDAISKCLKGVGLLFLGRRGIQGKLIRRIRPPGAAEGPAGLAGSGLPGRPGGQLVAPGRRLDDASSHDALVASWQARLPAMSSELEGDQVVSLMATRSCRLLVLTRQHVLYLRATAPARGHLAGGFSYTIRWLLPCSRVDHVRGEEERLKIVMEYHSQLRVPQISVWKQRRAAAAAEGGGEDKSKKMMGKTSTSTATANMPAVVIGTLAAGGQPDGRVLLRIPLQRSLRCASPELYQQVIRAISRHLVQMASTDVAGEGADRLTGMQAKESAAVCSREEVAGRSSAEMPSEGHADLYTVS